MSSSHWRVVHQGGAGFQNDSPCSVFQDESPWVHSNCQMYLGEAKNCFLECSLETLYVCQKCSHSTYLHVHSGKKQEPSMVEGSCLDRWFQYHNPGIFCGVSRSRSSDFPQWRDMHVQKGILDGEGACGQREQRVLVVIVSDEVSGHWQQEPLEHFKRW